MTAEPIGKGDLVRALIDAYPFHQGQILTVSACGVADPSFEKWCAFCGPDSRHWLRFEEIPVSKGISGACINHFRKLSGPPDEEVIREAERDNPMFLVPSPRIMA